jgi:hypothetical protein
LEHSFGQKVGKNDVFGAVLMEELRCFPHTSWKLFLHLGLANDQKPILLSSAHGILSNFQTATEVLFVPLQPKKRAT